ncbi:hypothetical protein LWI29_000566 [Acer saccharum]|uniref:Retrovirus-related Pol polyprotein from transposon TNT 1-94-like beta-barrel domain-containing protein n=1 Tax=Acer saccharum TaxID=4024 RepID=A0AA39T6A6_ACESA|nr:hypothetical protein LWI29_000566 [Acer saccharum]
MKFYADRNKTERKFEVGDWVCLRLQPYRQPSVVIRWNFKLAPSLYHYVDGIAPAPSTLLPAATTTDVDTAVVPVPNPVYLKWFQQDQLVVSYLVSTLTEPMLSLIVGKTNAFDMWTCLKDNFSQHSFASAANIRFQLMDMSKGTKTISAYLQHAKSLSDSLVAIKEPVSTTNLVTVVLCGLDSDYGMIITAILNFPHLSKFEDLCVRLLLYESQLLHTSPLIHGQHRGFGYGGRCGHSCGRGRGILGAPTSQWCSTCSTPQHSNLTCPHRNHGHGSLTSPFASMHVALYQPPPDYTWYPDTGATHHMTSTAPPDSIMFNGNTSILLDNWATLLITNIGNLPLSLGSHKFFLSNIFQVPSLNKNLLPVTRFTKDNFVSFTFTPSDYTISDHTFGVLLFHGPCKDGLYSLSPSQAFALAASASNLWHLHLGHPSSAVSDFPLQYVTLELHHLDSTVPIELPALSCADQAPPCDDAAPHVPMLVAIPHVPTSAAAAPPQSPPPTLVPTHHMTTRLRLYVIVMV